MIREIRQFLKDTLERDVSGEPYGKRTLLRIYQILHASIRDLSDGQLSLQAMSLVYTTLITLVPLLAISFSVLKGFGVHNQIEPALLNMLSGLGPEKSREVTERVIGFVDNIKVGVLGTVGLALLIYAVIALMQKIEAAFNYIWRVGQDRTFAQRFSDYLSVLLMGPLLIFISAGITATVRNSKVIVRLEETGILGPVFDIFSLLVPWIVMAVGFTFVYVYMPNTRVRISAGFAGGLVAALLWKAMGYVFASVIAGSANYVAIYAAFATLIVLMIWLYASWLVVLIGANISFYVQYPRYLRISRTPLVLSPHLKVLLGLAAVSEIARAYYRREEAWTADSLSKKLNVPVLALQKVLGILEEGGILAVSGSDPARYYPACPPDTTPLHRVIEALEHKGQQGWLQTGHMNLPPPVLKTIGALDKARQEALSARPIAEVLLSPGDRPDSQ